MTLREIEFFYELSENSHVLELSKKLNISQSAISLAIKSLEKKLGEPLFDRIGKKLILNERGRDFKEKTHKSFLTLKDAENFFKEEKISGNLHIASSKTIGNYITTGIVFDFLTKHKKVRINHEIQNSSQIIEKVKNGNLDIGFIEVECSENELIKEVLEEDELIIVSSDEKLKNEVYLDELFSKKWVLREIGSGTRDMFLSGIGSLSKEINIFMEYMDFAQIKELLVNKHDVITCISRVVVQKEIDAKLLKEIKLKNITISRNFYCIYHKRKYISRLFQTFIDFSKKEFKYTYK